MNPITASILALSLTLATAFPAFAQDYTGSGDGYFEQVDQGQPSHDDLGELRKEKYKTALARERAQQAYHDNLARHYESQGRIRETYYRRAEQERRYDRRTDDINTVNQAANTISSAIRQMQILSGRGY